MPPRNVAVVDIGKTNAKLALVDLETLSEVDVRRTPNRVLADGPYPHFDEEALWRFILGSLSELNRERTIEAISVTAHGATAALVGDDGRLALPILDYEHRGPDSLAGDYARARPPFAETGSPRSPGGLNLGAQLYWLEKSYPEPFARARWLLTYPQYWTYRLSGVASIERTSLGAHTDLWNPAEDRYTRLVGETGWQRLLPPLRKAADILGPVRPGVARSTGLRSDCRVVCGIHDSNASLLPHLLTQERPFSVVSTGTWVISMAVGGAAVELDERRDTLVNVSAFGDAVPSARFMGGREFSAMLGDSPAAATEADLRHVVDRRIMLLPSVQPGTGPFPGMRCTWVGEGEGLAPGERTAAVSIYLALMTGTCLEMIGSRGPNLIEGPFALNAVFGSVLAAVTGRPTAGGSAQTTGTSIGAALLADTGRAASIAPAAQVAAGGSMAGAVRSYAEEWLGRATRRS